MGKILVTSKKSTSEKMREYFNSFSINYVCDDSFGSVTIYNKLRIDVENYYEAPDGFCACAGTMIYKNQLGKSALQLIYSEYEGDVGIIQHNALGSYCIVIYKNNSLSIFVDSAGLYNLYIYDGNEIIITNTYYHIAKYKNLSASDEQIVSTWLKRSILSRTTPFDSIHKLCGHESIEYKNGKWKVENHSALKSSNCNLVQEIRNLYTCLPNTFKQFGLFLTGGQDSRLSLALLLSLNIKPTLYYGQGNSFTTATKEEDRKIVKCVSEKFNLPLVYMNWNESEKENINHYLNTYGELYSIYDMNRNIFYEFENNITTDVLFFGYFGEVYRAIEDIERYTKDIFTLDEYLDDIFLSSFKDILCESAYNELKKKVKESYVSVCKQKDINVSSISKDDFQKLNTPYREVWDTKMENFANQFFYSFSLFGNKRLTQIVESVPYSCKLNSVYLLETMESLNKDLIYIPFFSHMKRKVFDKSTHTLKDKQWISRVKDRVRPLLRTKFILQLARNIYYILKNDKKSLKELNQKSKDISLELETIRKSSIGQRLNWRNIDLLPNRRMMNDLINIILSLPEFNGWNMNK